MTTIDPSTIDWSWIDPIAWPGAWDVVVLGGFTTPGRGRLTQCERKYKWKVPESMGTSGAIPTYQNELIAKPKLTILVWNRAQFAALEQFLAICKKAPDAKEPVALTLEHPEAQRHGINSVVVDTIGDIDGDAKTGWTRVIDLIEVRKPKPVGGGAAGGGGSGKAWNQVEDAANAVANSSVVKTVENLVDDLYHAASGGSSGTTETGTGPKGGGPEWL